MRTLRNVKVHQHAGAWGAQIADDEQNGGSRIARSAPPPTTRP